MGINNDYMMLKLSGNSQYTPIALDDGTLSPSFTGGEDLQLIGWGRTSGGGPISTILQEVELDYLTNAQCAQTWGNFITDKMLCVNSSGKSACNGDSGGPLFIYDPTGATPPVQVGVVSWGSSQCICTPSVFARVAKKLPGSTATLICGLAVAAADPILLLHRLPLHHLAPVRMTPASSIVLEIVAMLAAVPRTRPVVFAAEELLNRLLL